MDQKKLVNFLSFWVSNTIVLLLAAAIFRNTIVLGNDKVSAPMAAIVSGLILTALIFIMPPIVEKSGYKLSPLKIADIKVKTENVWLVIFFAVNLVVLWIIKRLAIVTGLGIANILWVLVLAVVITLVEWAIGQLTGAIRSKA